MQIKKAAMAGTLESSDAQVTVEPGNGSVELSIESSVIHQFGYPGYAGSVIPCPSGSAVFHFHGSICHRTDRKLPERKAAE